MTTAYGYGGEFSSDEDIDKIELQSERLVNSKFDNEQVKPNRHQIEETIEAIRRVPLDQDIQISDEILAGILDFYHKKRGPIVESTRNLYKKIVLRIIHGEQQQGNGTESNGNKDGINNNNNLIIKKPIQVADSFSSDEDDEPMPPVSVDTANKRKFDSRVVNDNKAEPMEVDAEKTTGEMRDRLNDTTEEEEESEEEESESETSDSEELDLTPDEPHNCLTHWLDKAPKASSTPLAATAKKQPVAAPRAKNTTESAKKPYTRSQKVAATRAGTSSTVKKADSSKAEVATSGLSSNRSSSMVKYIVTALLVAVFAFLIFYFKSEVLKSTDRLLSRKISF